MIPTKEEWRQALIDRHGENRQEKFESSTIAICGLGGLGSNLSISLARAGVGKLILIDFDKVDITNLHRQQYKYTQLDLFKTDALKQNLSEINPYIEIKTHTIRLTRENAKSFLEEADIICEAFDNPEAKAMLTDLVLEEFPEKYLVAASGMAGFASANMIQTKKITKKFYLCGDGISDVSDGIGLVSSRVMLCAGHQAHMVLRILSGKLEV